MKKGIIYILCPAYYRSGGPELLHQLLYQLNLINVNAVIVYFNISKSNTSSPCNQYFQKYLNNKWITEDKIIDNEINSLIVPETEILRLVKYKHLKKIIWWLSVDNFLSRNNFFNILKYTSFKHAFGELIKGKAFDKEKLIRNVNLNICQSFYAISYLRKINIKENRIKYLSDYINDFYLNESKSVSFNGKLRCNKVFFNPAKGFKFTQKIINYSKKRKLEIKWVPIKHLSNEEILKEFKNGKVYIDFGNHPGKDRMPREAAILGCCIITDKKGSAGYQQDVPIPEEYKFNDKDSDLIKIVNRICFCLKNYNEAIKDFEDYRAKIINEKNRFLNDIEKIFKNI